MTDEELPSLTDRLQRLERRMRWERTKTEELQAYSDKVNKKLTIILLLVFVTFILMLSLQIKEQLA